MDNNFEATLFADTEAEIKQKKLEDSELLLTLDACEELPCGYIDAEGALHKDFVLSELTGIDEDTLANETYLRQGTVIDLILANTLERLGPIENPMGDNGYRKNREAMQEAVRSLKVGDRYFLLLKLRQKSLGDLFEAQVTCPNCKATSNCGLHLGSLEVKTMNEGVKREFEGRTATDTFKFKILTGAHEDTLKRIRKEKKAEMITSLLFVKLTELNGKKPTLKDLKLISSKRRNQMRDEMLRVEGGVETEVDADCKECGSVWKMELPIAQRTFFFPSGI